MNRFNSLRISRKILLAFSCVLAVIVAVGAVTSYEVVKARQLVDDSQRVFALVNDINAMHEVASDQLAAVRGLLLTGMIGSSGRGEHLGSPTLLAIQVSERPALEENRIHAKPSYASPNRPGQQHQPVQACRDL